MIGVLAKSEQLPVVAEFFELFKTPWEPYRRGSAYDVVIATNGEAPHQMPKLFVSCDLARRSSGVGVAAGNRHGACIVTDGDWRVPVYGEVTTFVQTGAWVEHLTADGQVVAVRTQAGVGSVLKLGYDLFEEVRILLSVGQPVEHAGMPALDAHIAMLRQWMLDADVAVVEILPVPAGRDFAVCLTHDIDFVGIRRHLFDHTMWGFLHRSIVGTLRDALRKRISASRLWKAWRAAASLPFVYLGWAKDFWEPFDWYLETEKGLPATYYLIPFKHRPGDGIDRRKVSRRGTAYDVTDIPQSVATLAANGCEVSVHGIDAWHDAKKGCEELARVRGVTPNAAAGIRMHWLLQDANTPAVLEQAGFAYDSTSGYNETIGYRNGTTQVFRPLSVAKLLELPMHIQDGALFYPQRLNLSERDAMMRCERVLEHVRRVGGVVTVLWHDRSHGPERFWGEFYRELVQRLRSSNAWFGTGSQVVGWFRQRRAVRFVRVDSIGTTRVAVRYEGDVVDPPLCVRISSPSARSAASGTPGAVEVAWNGRIAFQTDPTLGFIPDRSSQVPAAASL